MTRIATWLVLAGALLTSAVPVLLGFALGEAQAGRYTVGIPLAQTWFFMMGLPGALTALVAIYQLVRRVDRPSAVLAFLGGFVIASIAMWGEYVGLRMPMDLRMVTYHYVAGAITMLGAVLQLGQAEDRASPAPRAASPRR